MGNMPQSRKNISLKKWALWGIGLLLLCSAAVFLLWYLPLDPKSPPATEPGASPEFDALLDKGNSDWSFLFSADNKIVETDIYGENQRVVFDIVKATHDSNSELLYDFSISPDGRLLALNYFNERDPFDEFHALIGRIMLVDLQTGTAVDVPISLDGYRFDWTTPVYWLSSDVFLVKMHRFLGNDSSSEDVVFLRYGQQDIQSFQRIEVDHCGVTAVTKHDSSALLFTSNCISSNESRVQALDLQGKRKASPEEIVFFNECYSEWWLGNFCSQNLLTESAVTIRIERVVGDYTVEGFGRWYDNNWDRDYIYLNDRIVRISDGPIEWEPVWDPDLNLLTWDEGHKTFQMDNQGHYRFWYDGKYIGKIHRN